MSERTREDLERRYGGFLGFVNDSGFLKADAGPAAHVTPDLVHGFVEHVRPHWRSVTLAQVVFKIRRVAEILAPGTDFDWLRELEKDLALVAVPQPRFDRLVTADLVLEAGLTLMKEAGLNVNGTPFRRAITARNGLMLMILVLCPIRLGNFAALTLGRTFRQVDGQWWITLSQDDTKERRPDERPIPEPDLLGPAIDIYLRCYRPILLGETETVYEQGNLFQAPCRRGRSTQALWVGQRGGALSQSQVYTTIMDTTRQTIGTAIHPHQFRSIAAVTCSFFAPANPNLASAVLHHRDPRVTREHYTRTSSMSAAIEFRELVREETS
jgi:integrase